jgi:ribosomal protein L32
MQQNKKPPTGDEPAERAGSLPVGGFAFGRPSLDVDFEELSWEELCRPLLCRKRAKSAEQRFFKEFETFRSVAQNMGNYKNAHHVIRNCGVEQKIGENGPWSKSGL